MEKIETAESQPGNVKSVEKAGSSSGDSSGAQYESVVREKGGEGESMQAKKTQTRTTQSDKKSMAATAGEQPKKPNVFKRAWIWLDLQPPQIILMAKAALPPVIALSMYQSDKVANYYTTIGYLIAISSMLGVCIMPRAKFIQTMVMNLFSLCLGGAMALLALWTGIKARENTTPANASPAVLAGYNSSQCAVLAIWLFFNVFAVNAIRSALPQLQITAILYSIFISVALTYGSHFPTMTYAESFVKKLMVTFLTGFAIATSVSFVVFPVTCRTIMFKQLTGYMMLLRKLLGAQVGYMQSIEHEDMFLGPGGGLGRIRSKAAIAQTGPPKPSPQVKAVKETLGALKALHGTIAADMPFVKRESSIGKLSAKDISQIVTRLRYVFLPLTGMSSLLDIFQRIADSHGWVGDMKGNAELLEEHREAFETITAGMREDMDEATAVKKWQEVMQALHEPMAEIQSAMDQAIMHVLITFELVPRPGAKKFGLFGGKKQPPNDAEAGAQAAPKPGDPAFAEEFEKKCHQFYKNKSVTLQDWLHKKGLDAPEQGFYEAYVEWHKEQDSVPPTEDARDQRHLFLMLFLDYLMWCAAKALLDLVRFADSKVDDGTMKSKRLIFPGRKTLIKWIRTFGTHEPNGRTDEADQITFVAQNEDIAMGDSYTKRKNPERLPPENWGQRVGEWIHKIPELFKNPHTLFGFRVACAALSIGIVAYLKQSSDFFQQQRLVWAMIMVVISMSRTAGQSLFNFILRSLGTLIAMIASFVVWYIVDGKTPGILVFTYIAIFLFMYVLIKMPKYLVIGMITAITVILIIGYELQIRKIGMDLGTSNGQPYYPIYELAPYRLATVVGGLFVAFFWTIFPFPISEHSELRKDMAPAIFVLAKFYEVVRQGVRARLRGDLGDLDDRNSPGYKMNKHRYKLFAKESLLIVRMRQWSEFGRWQLSLGGKFPKETYDSMINCVESILNYTMLISYSARTFQLDPKMAVIRLGTTDPAVVEAAERRAQEWRADFKTLLDSVQTTSHEVTSTLFLLSNSISNGMPLPPYMKMPEPFHMLQRMKALDRNILDVSHIDEPGYAAFAVMMIASRSVIADLYKLQHLTKRLVGELDFGYSVSPSSSERTSRTVTREESDPNADMDETVPVRCDTDYPVPEEEKAKRKSWRSKKKQT